MDAFKASLHAQALWFVLATVYNGFSLAVILNGGQGFAGGFSTTQTAQIAVLLFGAVTVTGYLKSMLIFKLGAPLVIIALLTGGVIKHLLLGPSGYASFAHWLAAIAINFFGVLAFLAGVYAAFRKAPD